MATQELKFTKKELQAITPPGTKHRDYKDSENKYLRLRVTAADNRTFYLVRKIRGKVRFVKLGRFPDMTVQQARKRCEETSAELLQGHDPARPDVVRMTFGDLWYEYIRGHAKRFKKTWQEDERLHDRLFKHWDNKPLTDITRKTAMQLHARITKKNGPFAANRVIEIIRKAFNFAADSLELDVKNPAARIKKNRERSRERFLKPDELKRFFDALYNRIEDEPPKKHTSPLWQDFFALCLWTGARRGNVQAMRWEHIDLKADLWKIPGTEFKNGEPFTCVLSEPALEIVNRRKAENESSKYVFPSRSKTGHVVEPRKPWQSILKRAKLEDVRLHDLRRTLGSWQAASGASLQVIGKSLGHRNQATTAIYSRLNLDPVKASINTATAAMLQAINGEENK